ncbi:MAG: hypothetical protein Q8P83_00755 [bacterium]|nr:hypothetical protein [bacterium]
MRSREKDNSSPVDEAPFNDLEIISAGKYNEVKIPIDNPDAVIKQERTKFPENRSKGRYALNSLEHVASDLQTYRK